MSSIVSRRPSSMNHLKEAFWMSIRFGRSSTCLRREKLLRARGAATLVAKRFKPPYETLEMRTGEDDGGTHKHSERHPATAKVSARVLQAELSVADGVNVTRAADLAVGLKSEWAR